MTATPNPRALPPDTYTVRHGWMEQSSRRFDSFAEALAFARRKRAEYVKDGRLTVSIYNDNKADQDSYGLSDAESQEWENQS